MIKFVMVWNGGLYFKGNKNGFSRYELCEIFSSEFGLEELMMGNGEVYSVNDGVDKMIECGSEGVELFNEECVEMGDDFVNVSIVEINVGVVKLDVRDLFNGEVEGCKFIEEFDVDLDGEGGVDINDFDFSGCEVMLVKSEGYRGVGCYEGMVVKEGVRYYMDIVGDGEIFKIKI
jgi:hypothetical protein